MFKSESRTAVPTEKGLSPAKLGNLLILKGFSVDHIKDCGFNWVILGHSERRNLKEIVETDAFIATKALKAVEKGLNVMYCVGEKLEEREADKTFAVLEG